MLRSEALEHIYNKENKRQNKSWYASRPDPGNIKRGRVFAIDWW
jgi:hypothetical protein